MTVDPWEMLLLRIAKQILSFDGGAYELFAAEADSATGVGSDLMLLRLQHSFDSPLRHADELRKLALEWQRMYAPLSIPESEPARVVPLARLRAQEQRILELVKAHGLDPTALPPRVPGKPGTKKAIREIALREPNIFSLKTFNTAWQRLRSSGELHESE